MSTVDQLTPQPEPEIMGRSVSWYALSLFRYPQTMTVLLLISAFAVGASLSDRFMDLRYQLDRTSDYMEVGVMALAMTLVIISGNIDLSVASNLGLTCVVCAKAYASIHVPMVLVIFMAPVLGGFLGLINGLLITKLRLPSLTVTLGTLALYRGLAQVVAGEASIGKFPEWFVGIDYRKFGIDYGNLHDLIPLPLIIFLGLALTVGVLLRKTIFGRCVYAIGTNEPAARFSGIQVDKIKIAVFALSGMSAGVGAIMMMSRLMEAHFDHAQGAELAVITAVVLGGTDIFGGRGGVLGTVIALFLLGVISRAMGVANIAAENQLAVTGTLLVVSVLLARISNWVDQRMTRLRH